MTALAKMNTPGTLAESIQVAAALARSNYFADAREADQALTKILAGAELGFPPVVSMTSIYIVKGRVTLSANLIAAAIKRSGRYNYRVKRLDAEACEIEFLEGGQVLGTSSFTIQNARAARLNGDNWTHYPRNMLFARALSNGAKWFCPDVFGGPVYTPDEMAQDAQPEALPEGVIEGTAQDVTAEAQPASDAQHAASTNGNGHSPTNGAATATGSTTRAPALVREWIVERAIQLADRKPQQKHIGLVADVLESVFAGLALDPAQARHDVQLYLTGEQSLTAMSGGQVAALYAWLRPHQDAGGAWLPAPEAAREALAIRAAAIRAEDQPALPLAEAT